MMKKVCSIICIICAIICIITLGTFFNGEKTFFENIFTYGISFLFGGFASSYWFARYTIPKNVEEKIKLAEKEKVTFFTNLRKVIVDTWPSIKKKSGDFKTNEEYKAYNLGQEDGSISLKEELCKILHYGTEETNDMFENDWTKEDN